MKIARQQFFTGSVRGVGSRGGGGVDGGDCCRAGPDLVAVSGDQVSREPVKPRFLPPPMLPVSNKRYTRGVFELATGRTLHISSGVGYQRKVRFNVRPSVTVFTLRGVH